MGFEVVKKVEKNKNISNCCSKRIKMAPLFFFFFTCRNAGQKKGR